MKYKSARKPDKCPECGSDKIADILYGLPAFSPSLKKEIEDQEIVLGGCCISNESPTWKCVACNAFSTGKLCPTGWHVPSDVEWTTLTTYLGGESVAGGKLKEAGTAHYSSPNTGATNETGFTALPGGHRYYYATFVDNGLYGDWWSSTEVSATNAWTRSMDFDKTIVRRENSRFGNGYSVRCLKN